MTRQIPATMVTQHPDNAGKPYWSSKEFISAQEEAHECFLSFSELGVSEYKWDWEGKLVDEAVMERLLSTQYEYFKNNLIGRDKFLTFRIPNPKSETEFRLGRAFMVILGAAGLAKAAGIHTPPLFEVILPMTETAKEMLDVQEAFREVAQLKHHLLNMNPADLSHIELIPLFEQVEVMINSDKIILEYLKQHKKIFKFTPEYLRPYIARSDPALNAGLIATILATKITLSRYKKFEEKQGIKLYPIIGTGSLVFRGALSPVNIDGFMEEYKGIRTAVIQSAFRYDYNKIEVIEAINKLEKELKNKDPRILGKSEEEELIKIMNVSERYYKKTVEGLAETINKVAASVPKRRERVQHIGLFGYSRGVGKVTLPRAITFTASMYSLGTPPEFIGTGRTLKYAQKHGLLKLIEKNYLNLKKDLINTGRYLNKDSLKKLSEKSAVWKEYLQDIIEIEKYLGEKLGPKDSHEIEHANITSEINTKLNSGESITELVTQGGVKRKSLG